MVNYTLFCGQSANAHHQRTEYCFVEIPGGQKTVNVAHKVYVSAQVAGTLANGSLYTGTFRKAGLAGAVRYYAGPQADVQQLLTALGDGTNLGAAIALPTANYMSPNNAQVVGDERFSANKGAAGVTIANCAQQVNQVPQPGAAQPAQPVVPAGIMRMGAQAPAQLPAQAAGAGAAFQRVAPAANQVLTQDPKRVPGFFQAGVGPNNANSNVGNALYHLAHFNSTEGTLTPPFPSEAVRVAFHAKYHAQDANIRDADFNAMSQHLYEWELNPRNIANNLSNIICTVAHVDFLAPRGGGKLYKAPGCHSHRYGEAASMPGLMAGGVQAPLHDILDGLNKTFYRNVPWLIFVKMPIVEAYIRMYQHACDYFLLVLATGTPCHNDVWVEGQQLALERFASYVRVGSYLLSRLVGPSLVQAAKSNPGWEKDVQVRITGLEQTFPGLGEKINWINRVDAGDRQLKPGPHFNGETANLVHQMLSVHEWKGEVNYSGARPGELAWEPAFQDVMFVAGKGEKRSRYAELSLPSNGKDRQAAFLKGAGLYDDVVWVESEKVWKLPNEAFEVLKSRGLGEHRTLIRILNALGKIDSKE